MEKTFKQELKEFKETKFNLTRINVAAEVECAIDYYGFSDLTDDEFEVICGLVYDWYIGSDCNNLPMIVRCVLEALQDKIFTTKTFKLLLKNPSLAESVLCRYFSIKKN